MNYRGEYDVFEVCERTGRRKLLFSHHNELVDTWGVVAARCIGLGDRDYRLSAMYLEFENVDDPEDEVTIPEIDPEVGLDYYLDLASSDARDFLRVPLDVAPSLFVVDGFTSIPQGQGNGIQVYASTQGVVGVNGKTFSSGVNSKICGLAIVATPVWGDRTQDVVFARSYYEAEQQQVKQPSSQLAVSYRLQFAL